MREQISTLPLEKFSGKISVSDLQKEVSAKIPSAVIKVEYDKERKPARVVLFAPEGVDLSLLADLPLKHKPQKDDFERADTRTLEERVAALEDLVLKREKKGAA